ncbi:hypothetical protein KP509_10G064600 [Ceratopteris richardii]|uniref:Uncharacterized protein n=1 Tax=Ceratopteris richardii TaxID=49495 RepID=A0A8T2U5N2_CERRI|nr:hypothetical protein KP509_10G064600 [Ceratopteris richardii]
MRPSAENEDSLRALREFETRTLVGEKRLQNQIDRLIAEQNEEQRRTKRIRSVAEEGRAQVHVFTERWRVFEDRWGDLVKRVESVESTIQQYSLVDTALYHSEATPSLLQTRAKSVKKAIQRCANIIFQVLGKHFLTVPFLPILFSLFGLGVEGSMSPNRGRCMKVSLQALLCEIIFAGFEAPSFNIPQCMFEKPKILKEKRLEVFRKFVDEDFETLRSENHEFQAFLCQKWELLVAEIARFPISDMAQHLQDLSSHLKHAFGVLAMCVWLLHNVAFACAPASAEMFRVAPHSSFDEEYMREDMQREDTADIPNELRGRRVVAFMTVPGFTLRNSVVKADVCCFDSLV